MIIYQNKNVAKTLAFLNKTSLASFYSEKYQFLYTETEAVDFDELPFLTRQELVDTPIKNRTFIPPEEIAFFGFSSGTTSGTPLVSVFGKVENYHVEPSFGTGIRRPLIVYPPLNKNFGASFIQQCREAVHKVSPVFGDYERLANSAVLAEMTDCDSVYATPTIALKLAPYLKVHYDIEKILFLAVASELMTPYLWRQLRIAYPKAKISNLYASSEIGQFIMYTKPTLSTEYDERFILMTDTVAVAELVDGELIITYTANPAFPLLRYKTGDLFELCSKPEDKEIYLQMSGRDGVDVVKVGGFDIRSGDLDEWVAKLPHHLKEYQLHIYEQQTGGYRFELECVLKNKESATNIIGPLIELEFREKFKLSNSLSIANSVVAGHVADLPIVVFLDKVSVQSVKRKVLVLHNLE